MTDGNINHMGFIGEKNTIFAHKHSWAELFGYHKPLTELMMTYFTDTHENILYLPTNTSEQNCLAITSH